MSGDATVVAVRDLRVAYGSIVVLDDIELTVTAGEIVAVTGVNGVGKSTLLSCLAGLHGTAASRRDTNDQALRRMLGIDQRSALRARAVLPALLAAAWLALALTLLVATGVLHGWLWPLLGLVAGPGVAAASLRMARTAPINPADQGPNLPIGATPPWLISRLLSVVVGLIGGYPMLRAVQAGQLHSGTFVAQIVLSAVVLGGYLFIAGNMSP